MTQPRAKQIAAYLKLTSAFYRVSGIDKSAGLVIMDARNDLAIEMDIDTLFAAVDIASAIDYSYNFELPRRAA